MKTKHIHCRLWSLLLTLALCTHNGLADISLKLRGNNGYLPPPSQHLDNARYQSQQQQQQFQESNYGNSNYQIFEVHNHFETTPQSLQATQSTYAANGYLPPQQEIHVQHVQEVNNQLNAENEDNLNISFLSYAAGNTGDGQQITLTEQIPSVETTAAGSTISIPFPSNYQHNFPKKNVYKANEYLPPTQATTTPQQHPSTLRHPSTVTQQSSYQTFPHQQPQQAQIAGKYNAPQYLPPRDEQVAPGPELNAPQHYTQPQPTAPVYTQSTQPLSKPHYQAPTYLPPLRSQGQARQQFRSGAKRQRISAHRSKAEGKSQYNAPQYLPPQHETHAQPNTITAQNTNYRAPDYLPPVEPQQQVPTQNTAPNSFSQQTGPDQADFKGPGYLPPNEATNAVTQQQQFATTQSTQQTQTQSNYQSSTYTTGTQLTTISTTNPGQQQQSVAAVGALPSGYEYATPDEQAQRTYTQQLQQQQQNEANYQPVAPSDADTNFVRNGQNPSTPPGFLPSGYDYTNTATQSKTTPTYQHTSQQHQVTNDDAMQEIPGTTTTFGYQKSVEKQQERNIQYHYNQQQQQGSVQTLPPLPKPTPSIVQEILHDQPRFLPAGYDSPTPETAHAQTEEQLPLRPLPTPSIETQAATGGYLPPGYDHPAPITPIAVQNNYQPTSSAASSFPQPTPSIVEEVTYTKPLPSAQSEYRAPDYLPPAYDAPSPATTYTQQPQLQQQFVDSNAIQQNVGQQQETNAVRLTGELPNGYDFVKPDNAEEAIAELHSLQRMLEAQKKAQQQQQQQQQQLQQQQQQQQQPQQQNQAQFRSIQGVSSQRTVFGAQQQQTIEQPQQQAVSQQQQIITQQRQSGVQQQHQSQEVVVQSHLQVAPREEANDIVYGKPAPGQRVQQHNGYLPPHTSPKTTILSPVPQHSANQPFRGAYQQQQKQQQQQTFQQPQNPQQQRQTQTQNQYPQQQQQIITQNNGYLLPQPATSAAPRLEPHMYTLSSFMTTVQPSDRYGNSNFNTPRKPFPVYGPPTVSTIQPAHTSVYAQQNAVQQHYAPAMPYHSPAKVPAYTTYTYKQSSYTLSPETRETLQKFMPKDLQPHIGQTSYVVQPTTYVQPATPQPPPATLQTAQTSTAKIRTVQIFNPSAKKTLKVLETLDNAGVKTIKILGTSNEDPMGEHRIIKVVSQSPHNAHESHVQTVKIFSDQKEVKIPLTVSTVDNNNSNNNRGYLPPIATSTVRVARALQKDKPASLTGRRRYRL